MNRIKAQIAGHLDENNTDTRVIIDRNNRTVFRMMRNVGLVHFTSDKDPQRTSIGTGTVISDCYVLTSYHVVEGREIIEGEKLPRSGRRVQFAFGAIPGRPDGFAHDLDATVVDPGVLDLKDRRWSTDVVLLRFDEPLDKAAFGPIAIGTLQGTHVNTEDRTAFESQFYIAAGYPGSKIQALSSAALYADFCNPKSIAVNYGIFSSCVITKVSVVRTFGADRGVD